MRLILALTLALLTGCASAPTALTPEVALRFLLEHAPKPDRNRACPEGPPAWTAAEAFDVGGGSLELAVRFDPACPEDAPEVFKEAP